MATAANGPSATAKKREEAAMRAVGKARDAGLFDLLGDAAAHADSPPSADAVLADLLDMIPVALGGQGRRDGMTTQERLARLRSARQHLLGAAIFAKLLERHGITVYETVPEDGLPPLSMVWDRVHRSDWAGGTMPRNFLLRLTGDVSRVKVYAVGVGGKFGTSLYRSDSYFLRDSGPYLQVLLGGGRVPPYLELQNGGYAINAETPCGLRTLKDVLDLVKACTGVRHG